MIATIVYNCLKCGVHLFIFASNLPMVSSCLSCQCCYISSIFNIVIIIIFVPISIVVIVIIAVTIMIVIIITIIIALFNYSWFLCHKSELWAGQRCWQTSGYDDDADADAATSMLYQLWWQLLKINNNSCYHRHQLLTYYLVNIDFAGSALSQ